MTGIFHKYLELVEVRPKLRKMKEILSETPYTEDSKRTGQTGPSFRDLLDKVQASEKELKVASCAHAGAAVSGLGSLTRRTNI